MYNDIQNNKGHVRTKVEHFNKILKNMFLYYIYSWYEGRCC